jgi:hypothetical protein
MLTLPSRISKGDMPILRKELIIVGMEVRQHKGYGDTEIVDIYEDIPKWPNRGKRIASYMNIGGEWVRVA